MNLLLSDPAFLSVAGAASGGATLWTPAQITTALWLDATDSSTITQINGAVSQWNDKSGNGRNATQSTESAKPTISSINGQQALLFDGNDVLTTTISSGLSNSFCFFLIVNPLSTTANQGYVVSEVSSYSNYWAYLGTTPTGRLSAALFNGASNPVAATTATVATNSPVLLQLDRVSTSSLLLRQSGGLAGSNATSLTSVPAYSNFQIGAQVNVAGRYSNSVIGEVIVCASALTAETRQLTEGYLAHKWGLAASLPADHPYKSAAPTV